MNTKKILALLLTGLMIAGLAACGNQTPASVEGNSTIEETAGTEASYLALVNGREVTEDEFAYFCSYYMNYVKDSYGEIEDWTAEISDGQTYEQYVKEAALKWFVYAGALSQQAERLGISLTEEDQAALAAQWEDFLAGYDSEEAAMAVLEENHCTKELYQYILETQYLNDKIFENMYGAYGQALSDDECASMTEGQGYLMAKHILLTTTTTDDEGNNVDLTDEEKAERYATLEGLKQQLDNASDEERAELFDTLMAEYSEDPGSTSSPEGYLFVEGDMVTEFYEGTAALEEYEISDIVTTDYGYHLIERLPLNYDVIPTAYSYYSYYGYDYLTLRYLCADEAFSSSTSSWMDRVEWEITPAYEDLTLTQLMAVG